MLETPHYAALATVILEASSNNQAKIRGNCSTKAVARKRLVALNSPHRQHRQHISAVSPRPIMPITVEHVPGPRVRRIRTAGSNDLASRIDWIVWANSGRRQTVEGISKPINPGSKTSIRMSESQSDNAPRAYDGGANGAESSLLGEEYTDSMIKGNP